MRHCVRIDSRDPVGIYASKRRARVLALLGLETADKNTIGAEEIRHSGAFCKELRVRKNIEAAAWLGVCLEDGAHRFGGTAWDGRLFDDDLGGGRDVRDAARSALDVAIRQKCQLKHERI